MSQKEVPTVEGLKDWVRTLDSNLEENSEGFDAALVMLAALHIGTGRGAGRTLSDFTGVRYERVLDFQRNLQAAGIWRDGVTVANWNDEFNFWMDVLTARGLMQRSQ